MPQSHAKNNCARPVFTSHERKQLLGDWGTKTQRLGADSLKDFDCCSLCLHPAIDPLLCPEGHLFCKECIYENLLSQKEEISRQQARYDAQQKQLAEEAEQRTKEAKQAEIDQFAKLEGSIKSVRTDAFKSAQAAAAASSSAGPVLLLDNKPAGSSSGAAGPSGSPEASSSSALPKGPEERERDLLATAMARQKPQLSERAKEMKAFWIPYLTPEAAPDLIKAPSKHLRCTEGDHNLKLKELVPVNFTEVKGAPKGSASDAKHKYMCPGCQKTLTNAPKLSCLKPCGHIVCSGCVTKFVKVDGVCVACSKRCPEKDIIRVQAGGTGFAGHGDQLTSKTYTPNLGVS
eukprot:tig00000769_g4009.t1